MRETPLSCYAAVRYCLKCHVFVPCYTVGGRSCWHRSTYACKRTPDITFPERTPSSTAAERPLEPFVVYIRHALTYYTLPPPPQKKHPTCVIGIDPGTTYPSRKAGGQKSTASSSVPSTWTSAGTRPPRTSRKTRSAKKRGKRRGLSATPTVVRETLRAAGAAPFPRSQNARRGSRPSAHAEDPWTEACERLILSRL